MVEKGILTRWRLQHGERWLKGIGTLAWKRGFLTRERLQLFNEGIDKRNRWGGKGVFVASAIATQIEV